MAYKDAFSGAPWYEDWDVLDAQKIFEQAYSQKDFKGRIALVDESCLGFCFAYKVPLQDTRTVAFSKINEKLESSSYNGAFYLAECGVKRNYQNKGIGRAMISSLKNELENLVFRTKNPAMISLLEKEYDMPAKFLFSDPVQSEREWFGVSLK